MAESDRTASLMSRSRLATMNPKAGVTPARSLVSLSTQHPPH